MPAERMRLRHWLEEQINSGVVEGLVWIDKDEKIFQIPWIHGSSSGWELDKDAPLFKNWAIHSGKYHPEVDQPDPRTWKSNFRCAMNSLSDVVEVKDKSVKRGSKAFRVYKMLEEVKRPRRKGKKKEKKAKAKIKYAKENPVEQQVVNREEIDGLILGLKY